MNGMMFMHEEPTPTCTVAEGQDRYNRAQHVLEAIRERFQKCLPPPMSLPQLDEICRNTHVIEAPRVPVPYQLDFVVANIETIAGVLQWTVSAITLKYT